MRNCEGCTPGWKPRRRGEGDIRIAGLLGLEVSTVARGRRELLDQDVEVERVRRSGAGRWSLKKNAEVIPRIEEIMKHETAGNPMSGLKWTHRTTLKIAAELPSLGIPVSARTVAGLLQPMGFSLRVNHKNLSGGSHPDREAQFSRIAELREHCAAEPLPLIRVDTKKKELVGAFKNQGAKWDREPVLVNDHDFRSDAIAVPYGVYDLQANRGTRFVGTSYPPLLCSDTEFGLALPSRFEETVEIVTRKRLDFPAVLRPNEALDAFDI